VARDAAGNLYVSDRDTANVTRLAPSSLASFLVTLAGEDSEASEATAEFASAGMANEAAAEE
jgi:hypothetical protein